MTLYILTFYNIPFYNILRAFDIPNNRYPYQKVNACYYFQFYIHIELLVHLCGCFYLIKAKQVGNKDIKYKLQVNNTFVIKHDILSIIMYNVLHNFTITQ